MRICEQEFNVMTTQGLHSEIGSLRRVVVCRPGLAQQRLTPANCRDLLFDDVLWVEQARNDHDAFTNAMLSRDVEVLELHDLLATSMANPEARTWLLDRKLAQGTVDSELAQQLRPWLEALPPMRLAEHLIGGLARAALPFEPEGWPARRQETLLTAAVYRFHPLFAGKVKTWWGDHDVDHGGATLEGGDVMPLGNGVVLIGMGERTSPQAVSQLARALFAQGAATHVLAAQIPKSRGAMHLDTVFTFCDVYLVTCFPEMVDAI